MRSRFGLREPGEPDSEFGHDIIDHLVHFLFPIVKGEKESAPVLFYNGAPQLMGQSDAFLKYRIIPSLFISQSAVYNSGYFELRILKTAIRIAVPLVGNHSKMEQYPHLEGKCFRTLPRVFIVGENVGAMAVIKFPFPAAESGEIMLILSGTRYLAR